jgi:4-hydroxythreonine-4-phosphate dehydrogenase
MAPRIVITMGDPAGIGPEVVVKALARPDTAPDARLVVVGDLDRLARAAEICGLGAIHAEVHQVGSLPADLAWGRLDARAGEAAYQYVAEAVRLALAGEADAICTAPLNKEALHLAGHAFPGHTELLAHLTGTAEVSMMLTAPGLRVVHVTTHVGLLDAIALIDPGLVERTIRRTHEALVAAGIDHPRIAVCGINPHAGEHGLFGRGEEERQVVPGIRRAVDAGIDAVGPLPADTLFFRARRGEFDAVVAMYHDQGHGPVKVLGLEAGTNVTIGLPVVRTSVDHGTAFDIAGTGAADERSMVEAIRQAAAMARRR